MKKILAPLAILVSNSTVRKTFIAFVLACATALGFSFTSGCTAQQGRDVKTALQAADQGVRLACEGLAQSLAESAGADAQKIIAATCAVEGVTRTMRELLLSQQIEAAKAAGVLVPNVNSGHLERDNPYDATAE